MINKRTKSIDREYFCKFCGSPHKKKILLSKQKMNVGYSLVCCRCGHIDTFIANPNNKDNINIVVTGDYVPHHIKCIRGIGCTDTRCPLHPDRKPKKDKNPQTVYNDTIEKIEEDKFM